MATQVQNFSVPMTASGKSSGGIVSQISRLFLQPMAFFRAMPNQRQWMLAALLMLLITGYMSTTQIESSSVTISSSTAEESVTNAFGADFGGMTPPSGNNSFTPPNADASSTTDGDTSASTDLGSRDTTSAATGDTTTRQNRNSTSADTTDTSSTGTSSASSTDTSATSSGGFDLSLFAASSTEVTATQTQATASEELSTDEALMNALLAASRVLVMWAGQAALLSLISMFRGRSPQIGKSFQIAVWASLPLALMLIFRYAYFATGGDGGALGLSLLLENESIFSDMPELIQRMVVILFSNFTFFWLWSLFLLYLGARYALGGRRFIVMPVIAMWIIGATLIPALLAEPTNEITPRETVTASVSTADESSSSASNNTTTTQTEQQVFPGNNFGGGNFGGTTGGPGGGGPPG